MVLKSTWIIYILDVVSEVEKNQVGLEFSEKIYTFEEDVKGGMRLTD